MIKGYKKDIYNHLSDDGRDPEKFWLIMAFSVGFFFGAMAAVGIIL